MKTYSFLAARPGGYMNWPGAYITSSSNARVAAVLQFRKWFGREPSFSWLRKGHMAEATDERGNRIEIQQYQDLPDPVPQLPHRYASACRHHNWYLMSKYLGEMLALPALPAPSKLPTVGFTWAGIYVASGNLSLREKLFLNHVATVSRA